jgi:hypothetical protein
MEKGKILIFLIAIFVSLSLFYSNNFSNNDSKTAEILVKDFGLVLKNVSLLSPNASNEIEENYKDFLTPELLDQWKANPNEAIGRLTSSPWPDRIEVLGVIPSGSNKFEVLGNMVEVTSQTGAEITKPIEISVIKVDENWLISNVYLMSYDDIPSSFGNDQLEDAISNYLLTQNRFSWKTRENSFNFCSVENLDLDNGLFPFYVWAYCGEYIVENNELKTLSGSSGPVKIDYPNELSFYDLSRFSYEAPGDGSHYSEDIERIFPQELQQTIFNFNRNNIIAKAENMAFINILSWKAIESAVQDCQAEKAFQTHSRQVTLQLKDGNEIIAIEPDIDDIIRIIDAAEQKCGQVMVGTE